MLPKIIYKNIFLIPAFKPEFTNINKLKALITIIVLKLLHKEKQKQKGLTDLLHETKQLIKELNKFQI